MPVYVDGAIVPTPSADPTGPAGGVLTGTYPNPGLNAGAASTALGLGNAATRNVGTGNGDVAVGTTTTTANTALTNAATAQATADAAEPRSIIATAFAAGPVWSIIAPTSPNAGTSAATLPGGGLASFTVNTTGAMSGLSGPRIERTISWNGAKQWRLRVTPAAVAFTSATPNGAIYLRNSDGSLFVFTSLRAAGATGNIFALNAAGLIGGPAASQIPWAGTGTIELRFTDAGTMSYCGLDAAGTLVVISDVAAANAVLPFVPTHCGVLAQTGEASVGTFSFSGLVMESVG